MLVLTRKIGEAITLTNTETKETVEITYLGNNSATQVRIGIDAPRHINVARNELLAKDNLEKGENWGNR